MNTRVLGAEFDYYAPASLDEALEILATKSNVKILAGGTDLIVKMKTAGVSVDNMLDIKKIDELNFIEAGKCCCGGLSIGAGAKLSEIEEFPQIKNDYLALYEALKAMASNSVRNMGT
ncbi:MAG: FAD binding domain-containing protein, partial [Clostridiales bacterium]